MKQKKVKKTETTMFKSDIDLSSSLVRFDWAMKKLLRNKADYVVLEGLISVVINQTVKISRLLESESNRNSEDAKANRVDILAENQAGELFLIEIQNNTETAYFQRMLFGTSKLVTEYIKKGDRYDKIKKIFAINIVYFELGQGNDYIYHGITEFRGVHDGKLLELSPYQKMKFAVETVAKLYPEYYILKVNEFDKVATTPLEEWISYLKTGEIPETATAPGLKEAREILRIESLPKEEQNFYYRHIDNILSLKDTFYSTYDNGVFDGKEEGLKEGMEKGRIEGINESKIAIAKKMKEMGISPNVIFETTGIREGY